MKYLKYFEHSKLIIPEGKNYWAVKNDEIYLSKQLDKIDCTGNSKLTIMKSLKLFDEKILFIGIERIKTTHASYVDYYLLYDEGKYFMDKNYHYNGSIKLSKEELEEVKIEKDALKYNL